MPALLLLGDNFDPIVVHLNARDVTMIAVSRAPLAKLADYKERMAWRFHWVSSFESDFNYDYGVSFTPDQVAGEASYNYAFGHPPDTEAAGVSVFYKDAAGSVFHTYSAYARGIDMLNGAYHYLDHVPNGRGEDGQAPTMLGSAP